MQPSICISAIFLPNRVVMDIMGHRLPVRGRGSLSEHTKRRLAELLEPLVTTDGFSPSPLPGVELVRETTYIPRHPIVMMPRILVIAQGRKCVYLGDRSFLYDANSYLVLAVPMPFECEVMASSQEPLLGISISVDPMLVGELLLELGDHANCEPSSCVGLSALDSPVVDAAVRLAQVLGSPSDCRILGPYIVREIVYRVLVSREGDVLRLLTAHHSRIGHIARVLRHIHENYADDFDVASLSREASMALSTFHHAFRDATTISPMQYIKRIRLHAARTLILTQGLAAQEAARRVGYASASQFSREYRRMFGANPSSQKPTQTTNGNRTPYGGLVTSPVNADDDRGL
jgi:AraC-like DNA-binding protein